MPPSAKPCTPTLPSAIVPAPSPNTPTPLGLVVDPDTPIALPNANRPVLPLPDADACTPIPAGPVAFPQMAGPPVVARSTPKPYSGELCAFRFVAADASFCVEPIFNRSPFWASAGAGRPTAARTAATVP